jgi:creatinase
MKLRMIKSAEEIAHITQGAAVCDIGGFAVTAAIREVYQSMK